LTWIKKGYDLPCFGVYCLHLINFITVTNRASKDKIFLIGRATTRLRNNMVCYQKGANNRLWCQTVTTTIAGSDRYSSAKCGRDMLSQGRKGRLFERGKLGWIAYVIPALLQQDGCLSTHQDRFPIESN
jgi:hypothetical protein